MQTVLGILGSGRNWFQEKKSIRVLSAEAAVAEEHDLVHDVVAEAPAAKGKPVLAFAGRYNYRGADQDGDTGGPHLWSLPLCLS